MTTATISRELDFFLDLAKIGMNNPCCSSGETAAYELALCVLKRLYVLDDAAVAGFCEFLVLARNKPTTARDLLGC